MNFSDLPIVNAILNSSSALALLLGHYFIKRKMVAAHRACMLTVFGLSTLFLASYVVYHFEHGSQPFQGEGWSRPLYFSILSTHTILALTIVPMAIITLTRALKGNYDLHKRIARWTYPVWIYVSVSGVVIYLMLYQLFL